MCAGAASIDSMEEICDDRVADLDEGEPRFFGEEEDEGRVVVYPSDEEDGPMYGEEEEDAAKYAPEEDVEPACTYALRGAGVATRVVVRVDEGLEDRTGVAVRVNEDDGGLCDIARREVGKSEELLQG